MGLGKTLMILGVLLILAGGLVLVLGRIPGLGRLPGDILVKKENFTFYFPVTTSIIISLLLSLIFFLWRPR
ncbi:MAG: DUF2905 domain-containing protein [Candidatus Omnitrophica bacterium]|nr:DUF2905 domain-containing protein [Candidatus Omnitrophota bacterium]